MTAVFASSSPRTALLRALFHGPGRSINSGATIFQRGDPSRSLYFLATGVVKLTDVSPVGDEIIIRLIQPGDIFGERCFMGGATALGHVP